MTTALASSTARLLQLRDHAIEPVRTLADFVDEQHVAGRRVERVRRAERRQELRQRAAEQDAGGLAGPERLDAVGAASSPTGSARQRRPSERLAVVAGLAPARAGLPSIGP